MVGSCAWRFWRLLLLPLAGTSTIMSFCFVCSGLLLLLSPFLSLSTEETGMDCTMMFAEGLIVVGLPISNTTGLGVEMGPSIVQRKLLLPLLNCRTMAAPIMALVA